jgi:hypothetical protein
MHEHFCYVCEKPLTCCCSDARNVDRLTGKIRPFWCVNCKRIIESLKEYFKNEPAAIEALTGEQEKATK